MVDMVIRKASPDTDQVARSLLQKAIRRGNVAIARATFRYLVSEKADLSWLRSRLAVITFEEAWPFVEHVSFGRSEAEILDHYVALCRSFKNKDAAGLGSLAYALSQGDQSVLKGDEGDWFIRVVAKAITSRDGFWSWIVSEAVSRTEVAPTLAVRALEASKKAGWPWDKAFAYAAALFAAKYPLPVLARATDDGTDEFPFWIAIDKHTPMGKSTIRAVAAKMGVRSNTALWLSFYLESGVCSHLVDSPWWEREKKWRFAKLGLVAGQAEELWARLSPAVAEALSGEADRLRQQIGGYLDNARSASPRSGSPQEAQGSLFD